MKLRNEGDLYGIYFFIIYFYVFIVSLLDPFCLRICIAMNAEKSCTIENVFAFINVFTS